MIVTCLLLQLLNELEPDDITLLRELDIKLSTQCTLCNRQCCCVLGEVDIDFLKDIQHVSSSCYTQLSLLRQESLPVKVFSNEMFHNNRLSRNQSITECLLNF